MNGHNLDEYGSSCIIENVKGKSYNDYDEYENEYQPIKIEKYEKRD